VQDNGRHGSAKRSKAIRAFTSLVKTYQRPVHNLCYRMLQCRGCRRLLRDFPAGIQVDETLRQQPALFDLVCRLRRITASVNPPPAHTAGVGEDMTVPDLQSGARMGQH
jgi:hypothetical protein